MKNWNDVAQSICRGEFDKADDSTVESLIIGLKSLHTGRCQEALEKLCKLKKKRNPNETKKIRQ